MSSTDTAPERVPKVEGLSRGLEDSLRHDPTFSSVERGAVTLLADPEPKEVWCPFISVDDHALEPLDLFANRLPRQMLDRGPVVEWNSEGVPYWVIEDLREPIIVTNGSVGRPRNEWTHAPSKFEEFRPGVSDPGARVGDMHLDGCYAALNFPSLIFGFAGKVFSWMTDAEAGLASMRAWNDWMLEEWCGSHPEAFIPCQLPWFRDPHVAAAEIRCNAERGFRAVTFSENPEGLGFPSIHSGYWDPFFAACAETETVVNLHVGSSSNVNRPSSDSPREAVIALFPVNGIFASVDWVFSKVPVRFPDLKIVLSEAGASWAPMVIERLGRAYRQLGSPMSWTAADGDPVEIFRRNFYFASLEDPSAFHLLDVIGEDHVMVEMDYPHPDSVWPETQQLLRSETAHLDPKIVRKVCFENAATLYRHSGPPAEMLAASVIGGR